MKYLWAYSIPVVTFLSLFFQGIFSFSTAIFAFIIIPILETLLPIDTSNPPQNKLEKQGPSKWFNFLLYNNLIFVYGLLLYYLILISGTQIKLSEIVGLTLSVGIMLGSNGINVAHELGHRNQVFEKIIAKLLLLPSLYMHFFIEHNHGHHLEVATPKDPSTAKFNQNIFEFWVQTVLGTYKNAWKIQLKLNKLEKRSLFSLNSDLFWFSILQFIYLLLIYQFFGLIGFYGAVAVAVVSFLLLETINYIEHYGLLRKQLPSGRYERVNTKHSWNSNHILGRIILYELTRHSDHHYKSTKKYQTLEHHNESPQLPYGYPTSMVLALVPPLWFWIMNSRVPKSQIKKNRFEKNDFF